MPNPARVPAIVERVVASGDGIYEVRFASEGQFPRFKPGQFLHLTVDEYDPAGGYWPESRVFSIASPPGSTSLVIVYSVKGRYTRKMESYLAPGKPVWLKYPYGDFTISPVTRSTRAIVLIAGGTGISPYLSYLSSLCEHGAGAEGSLALYYGVRKPSHVLFAELLGRCSALGGFRLSLFVEGGDPVDIPVKGASVRRGVLNIDSIYEEARQSNKSVFYLSGPPAMIKAFQSRLGELGVTGSDIKVDEWE